MLFKISGKHLEVTEAIRNHAQSKTAKLPRYYSSINSVEVILDGAGGGSAVGVEIIARDVHNEAFVATESGEDACQCIDLAVHKLTRQLRRKKTKQRDNKHTHAPGGHHNTGTEVS